MLRDYLTHYDTKERTGERHEQTNRLAVYRALRPLLAAMVSPLPMTREEAASCTALMLDGFYIAYPSIREHRHLPGAKTDESVLLLAIDAITHQPLHWRIYRRLEDGLVWDRFFAELVALGFSPQYLIHDGHQGIQRASKKYLPDTLHQRCLVHMVRGVHKKLGITPKSPLAKQLQALIYRLVAVRTPEDRDAWLTAWSDYLAAFTKAELAGIPQTKALLSLQDILLHAYERNELFTFLDQPGLPSNTNAIESRNRVLREMLRRHRGTPLPQREAMVLWALLFKSTDDLTAIRAQYEQIMKLEAYTRSDT
jgi:hypothetical protein